ncbi:Oidioi.mRNA.OKI2018_I69.chr1.g3528.t1.cds [Oikopleura dioica]|uniref:Oidioi.mRNA.OKI2018_I69.chr1.g3528.t1.cds n=1 Tax=Oikopleura dioica TaxID=34765 RepID=A0ABN7T3J5_OIKDI|nr:Oidioi.mRNA.OKI2018_I69.chr1.g3528.t1.cds [Oikopleura dioica]
MDTEITLYSTPGCIYAQQMRLSLTNLGAQASLVTDEALSGTVQVEGRSFQNIIELGAALEQLGIKFFPEEERKRERQLKLALGFNQRMVQVFGVMMEDNVHRNDAFHLFMESLAIFENELIRCGRYFGGKAPGFLDIFLFPYIQRIGVWTPEFLKGELLRIQAWRRRMKEEELVMTDAHKTTRSGLLKYAKQLRQTPAEERAIKRLNSCGQLVED